MLGRFLILGMIISGFNANSQELMADPSLIKSIYFGGGSYYIDVHQAEELKTFIESFPDIQNYRVTVHSHTDNIGSAEFNQMLSKMRSLRAIEKLVEFNVPKELIEIRDFGEFNPVYDNSTLEGRLRNRRVDVILWPIEQL